MKDKLKKYLLPNLPYLFFVYLFDKVDRRCGSRRGLTSPASCFPLVTALPPPFLHSRRACTPQIYLWAFWARH